MCASWYMFTSLMILCTITSIILQPDASNLIFNWKANILNFHDQRIIQKAQSHIQCIANISSIKFQTPFDFKWFMSNYILKFRSDHILYLSHQIRIVSCASFFLLPLNILFITSLKLVNMIQHQNDWRKCEFSFFYFYFESVCDTQSDFIFE